jgi:hypothetical protein
MARHGVTPVAAAEAPVHPGQDAAKGCGSGSRECIRREVGRQSAEAIDSRIDPLRARASSFPSVEPLFLFFMVVVAFFMGVVARPSFEFLGRDSEHFVR